MIIYIHGFGSSGESYKAKLLKEKLKDTYKDFITPSLSYVPNLAIQTLTQLIESYLKYEKVYLMGSSLGGFYCIYLADKFNIPAVVINPAVKIPDQLKEFGLKTNYYDNSKFEATKEHLDSLKKYEVKNLKSELYFLLAKKGDEVLDYKDAKNLFKDSKSIIEDGGDHAFDDVDKYTNEIIKFFKGKV